MLLDILAVLCTLKIVFGIPVAVRLADTDNSAAVKAADIPQIANSRPPHSLPFDLLRCSFSNIVHFTLPLSLCILHSFQASNTNTSPFTGSSPFTNNPGPVIPGTLNIPTEQANAPGPVIPNTHPAPISQGTSNEDALWEILSRIAKSNSEGHDANALTTLLTNSTAEQATSNKEALRELLANDTATTTSSGDDDTLMALLIDADTTCDEAKLMALVADANTREEATGLMALLANTPGPILPRDAPNTPASLTPSDNDALMAFLAHASRSSSLIPQVDANTNTTQLIASTLDAAREKGRNPLGRTWEQLLGARDENGLDVPVVLVGMEECEARMKKMAKRDGEGQTEEEMGEGMEAGGMNEGEMREMGNWWCF